MKDISKTALFIVIMAMGLLSYGAFYKLSTNADKQQTQIDSMQTELLGCQIDNGRYEIILNNLWEADSNFVMEHTKYVE
jgi:hypothetical protein